MAKRNYTVKILKKIIITVFCLFNFLINNSYCQETSTAEQSLFKLSISGGRTQGEIELYGKKWTISFYDNMNSKIDSADYLYFLPADIKNSIPDNFRKSCPACETVFIDGHCYNISIELLGEENKQSRRLIFREIQKPSGLLNIKGKFIRFLALKSDSMFVVLDSPKSNVSIPEGNYICWDVLLDGGSEGLFQIAGTTNSTDVRENASKDLNIGGPLNNSIKVSRTGNVCRLDYGLLGIEGIKYESLGGSIDNTPSFIVYKGDKKIAFGSFVFG